MKVVKKHKLILKPAPEFFSPQVSEARRFYLNLNPPRKIPISVVSGGLEHCLPDYNIQRASFPFYSIEYVVRGAGSLRLNQRPYRLQPGTVFTNQASRTKLMPISSRRSSNILWTLRARIQRDASELPTCARKRFADGIATRTAKSFR
jgi:hypothetical protein